MPTQKVDFTQEVDYALIVSRKQSDRIFEQKHEGCIDHTIRQFISIDLKERWRCWEQFKVCRPTKSQKCKLHVIYGTRVNQQNQYWALTLKSSNTSIWFWMIGMVLRSFSVFMVLITPSDLWKEKERACFNKSNLIQISLSLLTLMEMCFLASTAHYFPGFFSVIRLGSSLWSPSHWITTKTSVNTSLLSV